MKKAKIYKPAKTAMQSGRSKSKKWLLVFDTLEECLKMINTLKLI